MSDSNLKLNKNIKGITIDGGTFISQKMLRKDVRRWKGKALLPGIGEDNFSLSDENLLRQLCYSLMPFTLIADTQTKVSAEIKRFPYSIDGNRAYQAFACRLVPEWGNISVKMHKHHNLAINAQEISHERIAMDLGNGSIHLEVYLTPKTSSDFPPLNPPASYKESVKL